MTAPALPPTGHAAAENALLAQLGLPPSAAPEDVDQLHMAVSEYLAAAPSGIRGWAHAQAAALDAAYLQLTDPVGLQGSALRVPTRPPRVDPGGPATPPARRDFLPAAPPPPGEAVTAEADDLDTDDVEALYAAVTPSAHRDMRPDDRPKSRWSRPPAGAAVVAQQAQAASNPWRKLVLGAVGIATALAILVGAYNLGGGGLAAIGTNRSTAQPVASSPAIDEAKVAGLMQKLQANPNDTTTLLALANEYYAGEQYDVAGQWLDKLLAIDPKNVDALLARGAVSFNLGDLTAAEKTWQQVVAIDPKNVEAHYDLGFLFLNQASPDWAGVQREWGLVVQLGPGTQLAQTVQQHLDSLAASSMMPGASGAASAAPSGSPAASPAASVAPSASPAASPAASTQP